MIKLTIIYDVVNMKKIFKSLRKLGVGVNRYTGVNWSNTTTCLVLCFLPSDSCAVTLYNQYIVEVTIRPGSGLLPVNASRPVNDHMIYQRSRKNVSWHSGRKPLYMVEGTFLYLQSRNLKPRDSISTRF